MEITYYFKAVEIDGTIWESIPISYKIFKPTENVNTLLIFNGLPESGYPSSYYFGQDDFIDNIPIDFPHDVWAFDEFDSTLVNNYQNIFEITSNGPNYYHRNIIRKWLEEDINRNYFLAGDEWLGAENGFSDTSYLPGSFEYDILGIIKSYNDVNYDGTSGQLIPSKLLQVENSLLGGALNNLFIKNGPTDSLRYDPVYENSWINNWIDAFEVVDSNNIDLLVETRGIKGQPSVQIKPCAVHNVTPNGNKIAFLAYDPISINSSPEYYWYGFSETSLQVQTLKWFGILTDINDEKSEIIPSRIQLFQNYPNPFNPSTTIKYQIPQVIARSEATRQSNVETGYIPSVRLIVYDILGREVAVLVNQKQKPGIYEIEFDAVNLPSGIYFYKLNYGYFSQTKKMILIK
ncbi:MAG: T9SS type A sorting domain-containing protein [Ignavibacteriales bacterium]|nr:T9SS type A sorting domain-containing protein [Ignavibacteriales bacterium]